MISSAHTPEGKIVTFYSYKGGTGRTMALANVAWILASSGKRVLAIDWDLEAPGLHRYFEPFLADKTLAYSTGVIDFVRDFVAAAVATRFNETTDEGAWYQEYANLLAHAVPLQYDFAAGGLLHFVPAGKQDPAYPLRVNSFDWHDFYEKLGGGVLLEAVKRNLREVYDVILIDSRTGVSDTSGVCTIQMPDHLVVCFTLNRQSIYGASSAARSAFRVRHNIEGKPTLTIWPLTTRVESSEKDRLDIAQTIARARFSGLMPQLDPETEERYWGEVPVSYEPYYAYEEVLAPFRDRPRQTGSMLYRMEMLAMFLNGESLLKTPPIDETMRTTGLAAFTTRSAHDFDQELSWLGEEYESLRARMKSGETRTELMSALVGRVQILGAQRDASAMAQQLFGRGTDGSRIVGLALARKDPQRGHIDLAISSIHESRSAFEQYHGLLLAAALLPMMHPSASGQLRAAVESQIGKQIDQSDPSRWLIAHRILKELESSFVPDTPPVPNELLASISNRPQPMVSIRPSSSHLRYLDGDESHGRWVKTRGDHALRLPSQIRFCRHLVTNLDFLQFVDAGGYSDSSLWLVSRSVISRFVTLDGTQGPGHWQNSRAIPNGKSDHPVTCVSFLEAQAYIRWCNRVNPPESGWVWSFPPEDQWEFVARTESGLLYPWGDAFDQTKCNSAESGLGDTSSVTQYAHGSSRDGCYDMAGNVWEFVQMGSNEQCVLRGGSFKNDSFVVRSHLRLFGVPLTHRPVDFGFRLAQVEVEKG